LCSPLEPNVMWLTTKSLAAEPLGPAPPISKYNFGYCPETASSTTPHSHNQSLSNLSKCVFVSCTRCTCVSLPFTLLYSSITCMCVSQWKYLQFCEWQLRVNYTDDKIFLYVAEWNLPKT
jgi:hypothetical protein